MDNLLLKFFEDLVHRRTCSREHVACAVEVLTFIESKVKGLPLPIAQATGYDTIQFAWDTGNQYLDIDIHSNCGIEWFYRNRSTRQIDGTEEVQLSADFPIQVITYLERMIKCPL